MQVRLDSILERPDHKLYMNLPYIAEHGLTNSLARRSHDRVLDLINGSIDVDYIGESVLQHLHFGAHCWDSLAGLKSIILSVGSFAYGDDVHVEVVDTIDAPLRMSVLRLAPGVEYFLTVEVQDHAGWISRRTSDGFTLDLVILPPVCSIHGSAITSLYFLCL